MKLEEEKVKDLTREHFDQQNRTRKWKLEEYWRNWLEEYKNPMVKIKDKGKNKLLEPISKEELNEVIMGTANGKAPGASEVSYEMLKNCGGKEQECFRNLLNNILKEGKTPKEWKHSRIFPIPKMEDWQGQMDKLRPIALIETGRRIFSKILTKRIDTVITENRILQENNWAGTTGGTTSKPRIILQNMIEDAQVSKKEIWILLQDTKKAFDSVGKKALEMTLERIGIPSKLTKIILEMREKRSADVITKYGITQEYRIKDGLDQGDPMSPLLWKIFYDPLISKINNTELGLTSGSIAQWVVLPGLQMHVPSSIPTRDKMHKLSFICGFHRVSTNVVPKHPDLDQIQLGCMKMGPLVFLTIVG
jgi:hypothetical protein